MPGPGLIRPILIGPQAKITGVAQECKLAISPYEGVDMPHSHAAAAGMLA
jgi:phosphate acetyltransferase